MESSTETASDSGDADEAVQSDTVTEEDSEKKILQQMTCIL